MIHFHVPPPYTAPRGQYKDYYIRSQFGSGLLPAYGGAPRQKGHSLGTFLGGLFKSAIPLLSHVGRSVAKTAGKALLSTGAGVLSDVLSGQSMGSSISNRSKAAGKQLLKRAATATQGYISSATSPSPPKRRATVKGTGRATTLVKRRKKNQKKKNQTTQRGQGRKRKNTISRAKVTLF